MNEPFVSFLDVGRALHAAHRDVNGTWVIERIASQARDSSSIATSSSGGVHVALINTSSRLAVASRNGSGDWTVTVVDSTNRQASPRLAIDASGARHVGYIHADDSFNYAWAPATGPWAIESSVASAAGQLTDVSLAVDAQGGVHACFVAQQQPKGVSHYTLEYLYKAPGGSWATKQVDTGYDAVPGSQTGLAVNPNGGVFIAYVDGTKGLQVARASMSAPTSTVTVGAGGALVDARFPSLARDASGVLHLVYASADRVWHTQSTGGDPSGWAPAEAVGFAGAAAGCALAVGTDGTVHASFQDVALTALQYARICP
jgi:hypothetical protein